MGFLDADLLPLAIILEITLRRKVKQVEWLEEECRLSAFQMSRVQRCGLIVCRTNLAGDFYATK